MRGERWSEAESRLISDLYPNIDALVLRLPNRSRLAILNKGRALGLAKPLQPHWTIREEKLIRRLHPNIAAIRKALPHRSDTAIETRITVLGIAERPRPWTREESTLLRSLVAVVTDEEAAKYLGRNTRAIATHRHKLGIRKPTGSSSVARLRVVDDIRQEAKRRNIALGRLLRSMNLQPLCPSTRLKQISWPQISRVVDALDGELYADWADD